MVQAEEKGEEEGGETGPFPLGLAAVFPTVCGEWLPSGVLNVTRPDREELAICVSEKGRDELRITLQSLGAHRVSAQLTQCFAGLKAVL